MGGTRYGFVRLGPDGNPLKRPGAEQGWSRSRLPASPNSARKRQGRPLPLIPVGMSPPCPLFAVWHSPSTSPPSALRLRLEQAVSHVERPPPAAVCTGEAPVPHWARKPYRRQRVQRAPPAACFVWGRGRSGSPSAWIPGEAEKMPFRSAASVLLPAFPPTESRKRRRT